MDVTNEDGSITYNKGEATERTVKKDGLNISVEVDPKIYTENDQLKTENESLKATLGMIAEKEFDGRLKKLEDEGFNVERIKSVEDLKAAEMVSEKYRKESYNGNTAPLSDSQYSGKPLRSNGNNEEEGFDSVETMIQHYRDKAAKGDKNANSMLIALTDKVAKSGNHEWVFDGKLADTRKPILDHYTHETKEQFDKRLAEWKKKQREMWRMVK